MIHKTRQLFDQYRQQFKSDPTTADKSLLAEAKAMLAQQLQQPELDSETIRLADDDSYFFQGDKNVTVNALSRYITQNLPPEEEAYARERLVDNLALLGRSEETVKCQLASLAWARRALPQERLMPLMFDSTQAYCWVETGKGEEWLEIFRELMASIVPTAENRSDRRIYLRTAGAVLCHMKNGREALIVAEKILKLGEEAPAWESVTHKIDAYTLQVRAHYLLQDDTKVRYMGNEATAFLEDYLRETSLMEAVQAGNLWMHFHTLASSLFFAHQYDLAIPLFRRAIELNSHSEHTYFWIAASVWVTTNERSEVIGWLKEGANRSLRKEGIWDYCCSLPEFQDVIDDAEMKSAVIPAS